MPRAVQQTEVLHLSRWQGQHKQSDVASQHCLKVTATLAWMKEGKKNSATGIPLAPLHNNKGIARSCTEENVC